MSWSLILEHLFIVLAASILSVCIGLPLGILAYVFPKARKAILWMVDLLQTIPALALLGIIMVFIGAGKPTVIAGITLYSLLPIVRNTCLGLQEVDPGVKEAARGMGMSKAYRVLRVEFPLALPTVFTGIRIAVVSAIGTAVFAAFVGGAVEICRNEFARMIISKPSTEITNKAVCDGMVVTKHIRTCILNNLNKLFRFGLRYISWLIRLRTIPFKNIWQCFL